MKTVHHLKQEIAALTKIDQKKADRKEIRSAKKAVAFLQSCLIYVETDPREEFIRQEIRRLELRIKTIKENFTCALLPESAEIRKLKKAYDKEWNVPVLKTQLKTLKFLIAEPA